MRRVRVRCGATASDVCARTLLASRGRVLARVSYRRATRRRAPRRRNVARRRGWGSSRALARASRRDRRGDGDVGLRPPRSAPRVHVQHGGRALRRTAQADRGGGERDRDRGASPGSLSEIERVGFRADFRDYLEARLEDQQAGADLPRIAAARQHSAAAQKRLWARASRMSQDPKALCREQPDDRGSQSDVRRSRPQVRRRDRARARRHHQAALGLCIAATFLYAYEATRAQKFEWLTAVAFVLVAALVVYVTLDLD